MDITNVLTSDYLDYLKKTDPHKYEMALQQLRDHAVENPENFEPTPTPTGFSSQNQNSPFFDTAPFSQPMYGGTTDELVPETQPEMQPRRGKGRGKGKGKATAEDDSPTTGPKKRVLYNESEEMILISSYFKVCMDPIVGTSMKFCTIFRRVDTDDIGVR